MYVTKQSIDEHEQKSLLFGKYENINFIPNLRKRKNLLLCCITLLGLNNDYAMLFTNDALQGFLFTDWRLQNPLYQQRM